MIYMDKADFLSRNNQSRFTEEEFREQFPEIEIPQVGVPYNFNGRMINVLSYEFLTLDQAGVYAFLHFIRDGIEGKRISVKHLVSFDPEPSAIETRQKKITKLEARISTGNSFIEGMEIKGASIVLPDTFEIVINTDPRAIDFIESTKTVLARHKKELAELLAQP